MNEKLKNLNKKQFEKCLISLEMLTFETPKIYTGGDRREELTLKG